MPHTGEGHWARHTILGRLATRPASYIVLACSFSTPYVCFIDDALLLAWPHYTLLIIYADIITIPNRMSQWIS